MGEWKKVKLGEILEEYCERNIDNKYMPVAVGKYGIRKREEIYSKELSKDISKNKVIRKDTLTIGMGSNQIDIGILVEDEKYCVSPAYTTYKIKNCDSKFLEYYLEYINPRLSDLFMIVSARQGKSVDKEGMMNYIIKIPNLKEQRKIVEILTKIDRIIQIYDNLIIKQKGYLEQELISYFGTLNNTKYPIKKLIDIVDKKDKNSLKRGPFGGSLKKQDFTSKGYLVYEQRHAIHNDFEYEKYYIDYEKYKKMEGFSVKPYDLIVSCSGATLGKIAEIPQNAKEGIINQALLKIKLNPNIMNNKFFIALFRGRDVQNKLLGVSRGTGMPNFPSMTEVKKLQFICPDIKLQNKVEEIVTLYDEKNKILNKQKYNYTRLKKGLMQKLLTGKVDINV